MTKTFLINAKNTSSEIIEEIKNACNDYYPTLNLGCVVLNHFYGDNEEQTVARTFDISEEEASALLASGEVEISPFDCVNPENEQSMLYLNVIHLNGTDVYFE